MLIILETKFQKHNLTSQIDGDNCLKVDVFEVTGEVNNENDQDGRRPYCTLRAARLRSKNVMVKSYINLFERHFQFVLKNSTKCGQMYGGKQVSALLKSSGKARIAHPTSTCIVLLLHKAQSIKYIFK